MTAERDRSPHLRALIAFSNVQDHFKPGRIGKEITELTRDEAASDVDSGRWQVSTNGGARPLWAPDGRELFYLTNDGVMGVTVDMDAGPGFRHGTPELIFAGQYAGTSTAFVAQNRTYDISPDGQRFLMLKAGGAADADDPFAGLTQIHVVTNWFQELKARVPTGQ